MLRKTLISLGLIVLASTCSTHTAVAEPETTDTYRALHDFEYFKTLPVAVQQDICESDAQCEWAFGLPLTATSESSLSGSVTAT